MTMIKALWAKYRTEVLTLSFATTALGISLAQLGKSSPILLALLLVALIGGCVGYYIGTCRAIGRPKDSGKLKKGTHYTVRRQFHDCEGLHIWVDDVVGVTYYIFRGDNRPRIVNERAYVWDGSALQVPQLS